MGKLRPADNPHVTIYPDNTLATDPNKKREALEEVTSILAKVGYDVSELKNSPFSIISNELYPTEYSPCSFIADILVQSIGNRAYWVEKKRIKQYQSYSHSAGYKIIIFKKGKETRFIFLDDILTLGYPIAWGYIIEDWDTQRLSTIDRYLLAVRKRQMGV